MNIEALKSELTTDPLGRGYAAMTDIAAAADLNTEYRTLVDEGLDELRYGDGLDFSHANTRTMIASVFAANATLRDTLLSWGVQAGEVWDHLAATPADDGQRARQLEEARTA